MDITMTSAGFLTLDNCIGGLKNGKFYTLAGSFSTGQTSDRV
jgi:hypothetical protein